MVRVKSKPPICWPIKGIEAWKSALLHATPVSLIIIGLFYYWFAFADRYVIFLYGHLGAKPFDQRTSSRYWMTGLVACGTVLILYSLANWFLGRLAGIRFKTYVPPLWWRRHSGGKCGCFAPCHWLPPSRPSR